MMRYPKKALATLLLLGAVPAAAQTLTGRPPACYDPRWLERMLVFIETGNRAGYEKYLNIGMCAILPEELKVTAVRRYTGPAERERLEFRFKGYTLYTVVEALEQDP